MISYRSMSSPKAIVVLAVYFVVSLSSFFLSEKASAETVTKKEVLKKYESVIVQSNQMNIYGYDLSDVTFKLKRLTEVLIANRFEQANNLLDEIEKDLEVIEE